MRVIDAFWDTRNLGVRCAELEFEREDGSLCVDDVSQAVLDYEYVAAKVPSNRPEILSALQGMGFAFVECSINFRHDLLDISVPATGIEQSRVSHRLAAADAERLYILDRVSEGLFGTDRIILDKCFTREQATHRYSSWIQDELGRGALLYDVLFDGEKVGFFSYKEIETGVSYPFLIGLYPEHRGKHLGSNLIAESLLLSREQGCHLSSTVVSSNNVAVIRCQESVGSYIHQLSHVLVRHQ